MSPPIPKSKRPACASEPRTGGTGKTARSDRTTCVLGSIHMDRTDAARNWVRDGRDRPLSREAFIDLAIDELTQRLLRENPDFRLPPSCAFMPESKPANP